MSVCKNMQRPRSQLKSSRSHLKSMPNIVGHKLASCCKFWVAGQQSSSIAENQINVPMSWTNNDKCTEYLNKSSLDDQKQSSTIYNCTHTETRTYIHSRKQSHKPIHARIYIYIHIIMRSWMCMLYKLLFRNNTNNKTMQSIRLCMQYIRSYCNCIWLNNIEYVF